MSDSWKEKKTGLAGELGRQMGISTAEASRVLNGECIGGCKILTGICQAFTTAEKKQLFILPLTEL